MAIGYKLTSDARQKFEIIVDGDRFSFDLYWNSTANKWFMDVSNSNTGNIIIAGECVVANIDYSARLGMAYSYFWIDGIEQYDQAIDPTRNGFDTVQFYVQPKDFSASGATSDVPVNVVTHNSLYVIHDGSYVTHTV